MKENDFCLDDVPFGLKLARPRKLEEDARRSVSNYFGLVSRDEDPVFGSGALYLKRREIFKRQLSILK